MSLIDVDGILVKYRVMGKGTPLLLLHGWGGSSESFLNLQKILAKRYQVITLDLPGFGETDIPLKPWNVEDYENFVLEFVKKLGIARFYLGGHSFGGRIAIMLCVSHPQSLIGLILIAAAGIGHKKSPQEATIGFIARVGKRIVSLPILSKAQRPVRALFYTLIRRKDYLLAEGVMKETMRKVISQDLRPYLSKIKIPTLIIWGNKDTLTPLADAYLMRQEIKGSILHIIKGASHYLPKQYYRELAKAINIFAV